MYSVLILITHIVAEAQREIRKIRSQFPNNFKCSGAFEKHVEMSAIIGTLNLAIAEESLARCINQIITFASVWVAFNK